MNKRLLLVLGSLALVTACATSPRFSEGQRLLEAGRADEGFAVLEEELKKDPDNAEIRNYYERQKAVAVQRYVHAADSARRQGFFNEADVAYRRALRIDPTSAQARDGLASAERDRQSAARIAQAEAALKSGDAQAAYAIAKEVLAEQPAHRQARAIARKVEEARHRDAGFAPKVSAALKKPVTMEFRDAPLRQVFELISRNTGLNFVFDKDVPPEAKATVYVRDTSIDDIVRFVLVTNGLDRRTLNESTILIYPNTPQKQQAYRDMIVRSFYLVNADAKQTANLIRQVVKTRDLFIDEKLNLVVMRDTPEAVRVAEKLVANQDLAEAEVMLEVEILEVSHNTLQQLGIELPGSLGLGLVGAAGVPGQLTGREARSINQDLWRVTVPDPLVTLSARRQDGRSNVLANPRIRVKSREKAKIHIGDKVPVITTTAGATGFVSESITYLDVGLKLEVEPHVHLEDDVGIKIGLEVSNIASQVRTSSGTIAYQLGTRNTSTTLRLRDGETQVLAGLINDEDRRTAVGTPGIADLPVLGRIFSNSDDRVNKTEVVLLITPRVLRNIERPGIELEHFSSGTEAEVGGAPLQLAAPVAGAPAYVAPLPGSAQPAAPQRLQPQGPVPVPAPGSQPAETPEMVSPPPGETIPPRSPAAGPAPKPSPQ